MPGLRSATTTTIGLLTGIITSVLIFVTQFSILHSMVYTTYVGLITTFQLYELAWILATLDYLLNFSNPISLLLWVLTAIVLALAIRQVNAALTAIMIAVLLPGGIWLLFTVKYATLIGFAPLHLLSFFLWQLILPLVSVSIISGLTALPFWAIQRGSKTGEETQRILQFACSGCGALYRSKPVICVECGKEGLVREYTE
jgi:hypothetical protein